MVAGTHGDPRTWERRWLEAVSRSCDAYLRSPLFLQLMKQNMDAVIETKLRFADWQKEFAHNTNLPTASDIRGLFDRLRSVEDSILARLEEREARLPPRGPQPRLGAAPGVANKVAKQWE